MNDLVPDHGRTLRRAWSTGRYPSLAPNLLQPIANLVHAGGIEPDDDVLDVGCGTGNVALTAGRNQANVVGIDLTRQMLDLAEKSSSLAGLNRLTWIEGDAQQLPFKPASFDVVLSNFGHIFAPSVERATSEMIRVTRPEGRVAFTAWTPTGIVGELAALLVDYTEGAENPLTGSLQWGDPTHVRNHTDHIRDLTFERRIARFRYVSPAHFWQEFAEESGPLSPVIGSVADTEGTKANLRDDALELLEDWFADNAIRVEYLLVKAIVE